MSIPRLARPPAGLCSAGQVQQPRTEVLPTGTPGVPGFMHQSRRFLGPAAPAQQLAELAVRALGFRPVGRHVARGGGQLGLHRGAAAVAGVGGLRAPLSGSAAAAALRACPLRGTRLALAAVTGPAPCDGRGSAHVLASTRRALEPGGARGVAQQSWPLARGRARLSHIGHQRSSGRSHACGRVHEQHAADCLAGQLSKQGLNSCWRSSLLESGELWTPHY